MRELGTTVMAYLRARHDLAPSTAANLRIQLRRFAFDLGWERSLAHIRTHHIEVWFSRKKWAPATSRQQLSVLRTFFAWCVDRTYLRRSPVASLRHVPLPRAVPRGLARPDISLVLDACTDSRSVLIVVLMCQEGLRCVEVSRLNLEHIDFGERIMLVRGKGGHERVLPVSDETLTAMLVYLTGYPASSGPLIRSYQRPSAGVTPDHIGSLVGRAMRAAGVKQRPYDGVSAHACRHSMATDLVRAGVHLRDIQQALGHASIATTQRYLPWLVGDLRDAMAGRHYQAPEPAADEDTG